MLLQRVMSPLAKTIIEHEGFRQFMYHDSVGVKTVGVGFNLERDDAEHKLQSVGADYHKVCKGRACLTITQVLQILEESIKEAEVVAYKLVPNLQWMSEARRTAIIDMAFNLGETRLRKFKNMIKALKQEDFELAAAEAQDSLWFTQVKSRGRKIVRMIREG